jgi:hypothetical protein
MYVYTSFITFSEKSCWTFLFFAVNDRFCNFVIKGKLNTIDTSFNETARFKECKLLFEYHQYSYLETSGGQSSNLYLNVVHFFQHQC